MRGMRAASNRRESISDPIRQWCRASLQHALDIAARFSSDSMQFDVERMIDLAAFLKLSRERQANISELDSLQAPDNFFLEQLVSTCPLVGNSSAELLSVVHETLVSLRPQANGTKRSRKAAGIHYTPQSVIDYILDYTLEPRLREISPNEIKSLSILDPACGCGNFLAAAFRRILDWGLNWAAKNDVQWKLTSEWAQSIASACLYGVDFDVGAIEVAKRVLWLIYHEYADAETRLEIKGDEWCPNLKHGHALLGSAFKTTDEPSSTQAFNWGTEFPGVAARGGFDVIVGNPPYRRERDFKVEMDEIAATDLGRYRLPRMDLWYYFVHRGVELLRDGGTLSFITNAYWMNGTGAEKLIAAFRDELHLDELFLLGDLPVFEGVTGQHVIFRATNSRLSQPISIKTVRSESNDSLETILNDPSSIRTITRKANDLFQPTHLSVRSLSRSFIERMNSHQRLGELGIVRQGIAENPSTINRRTLERFGEQAEANQWRIGEGVFSLTADEVNGLSLSEYEQQLLRPYHELSDIGRYWVAENASRKLVYSTRQTCPELASFPSLQNHLDRFRPIMEARRETLTGRNCWWHLHWPRDEELWKSNKIVALQMAARPSFVPTFEPTYVSFSANVFVPFKETREDLRYLTAVLNSKVIWAWLSQHAKRRGIGLELNGHVLREIPIPRVDFSDAVSVKAHDEISAFVNRRMQLARTHSANGSLADSSAIADCESALDFLVGQMFGVAGMLDPELDETKWV